MLQSAKEDRWTMSMRMVGAAITPALWLLLSLFGITSSATAQNMVMPKGLEHLTGNSQDGGSNWQARRFRLLALYDASEFPWNRNMPFTIHGIRVRRTALINTKFGDVRRRPTITISMDGGSPMVMNAMSSTTTSPFANWHNRNQQTFALQSDVDFPCQGEVAFGTAQPFAADFVFPSGQTYVVDTNAQSLTIDISITQTATSTQWLVDHETSQDGIDRGGLRQIGIRCPSTGIRGCERFRGPRPMADVGMSDMYVGGTFRIWNLPDVATPTAGSRGWGWIGDGFTPPFLFPPGCEIRIIPTVVIPTTFGAQNFMSINGTVPNLPNLINQKFGCQFAALDPGWPNGMGVSHAYVVTIGSGQPIDTQFSALYADSTSSGYPNSGAVTGSVPVLEFY